MYIEKEVTDNRYAVFSFMGGEFQYHPASDITQEERDELEPLLSSIEPGHDMTRLMKTLSKRSQRNFVLWKRPGFAYSTDTLP